MLIFRKGNFNTVRPISSQTMASPRTRKVLTELSRKEENKVNIFVR